MTTPLHLLILEDSNTDAELIISHLRQAGYELDWRQVTSREDFLAALDDDFDIILADYHLPKWNAMQALHLLKEKGIDIPVIVVTGAISEEVAVACMKEGASDYLIKDRLQRLGSAVAQVLENKKLQEQKRAFEAALLHAAEEWRRTFDAMSDMITVQDADFHIIRANRAIVDALGTSFQDILGKHCYQVIHDLSCPIVDCPTVKTKRTGKSEDAIIWEPKLGKWLMVRSSPIWDEEGNFRGVVHVMRDVSQNKAIEEALRESEERYRRLLDTSLVGIFIIQNGEVKYCNRGLAEIFGYDSPVQIQGKTIQELVYAEDYPEVVRAIEGTDPATNGARHYRFRGIRADGSLVHVDTLGQTIEYDGKPATQGFLIDITAQVQAERERLVRGRQQAVIAKLGQLALAGIPLDELMDKTVKMVAETLEVEFCKVLELQPDGNELLLKAGVGWQEGVVGQARVAITVNSQVGYTLATYEPVIVEDFLFETRFQISPLLNEHHVVSSISVIIHGQERPYGILGAHSARYRQFTRDDANFLQATANILAERIRQQRAEEALRESEWALGIRNRIAYILLSKPEAEIYDEVLQVVLQAMESEYGYFGYINEQGALVLPTLTTDVWEQCNMPDKESVFQPEEWGGLWGRALQEKRTLFANEGLSPPFGHVSIQCVIVTPILYQDVLVGIIAVANRPTPYTEKDVELLTSIADYVAPVLYAQLQQKIEKKERERLEEQYIQMQKLEAIGQLTTGIAHDFNNMLTPIISLAELIRVHTHPTDRNHHLAKDILQAGRRAAQLVQQLLAFSRKQIVRPKLLDAAEMLKESESVLLRVLPENIHLHIEAEIGQSFVYMDPTQWQQMILNLALNARDAISDGGHLTITLDNVTLSEKEAALLDEVEAGSYVRLIVRDTGMGMSEEVKARIFEPFFTTKQRGRGTGLGLASVYGTIKQNKGDILCESEEGKGTVFTIYLPRVSQPLSQPQHEDLSAVWLRGNETILLVEDDPNVRRTTLITLQQLGYTVLEAKDGPDAVLVASNYTEPIALLLTDVIMPGIDGAVLAQELKRFHPDMKVLFMSGYPGEVIAQRGILASATSFLYKPFTPQALGQKVRALLDGKEAG